MGKTESFEFLNELALAFRRGEKNARPQHTPILEGVRAVLAHLQSTGRLLVAAEQRLTAEQVENVQTAREALRGYRNFDGNARGRVNQLIAAVDALFPATETAEDAPCAICNVNETNHAGVSYYHPFTTELGPFDDDGNDRPAPAEPAEEGTKAERRDPDELAKRMALIWEGGWDEFDEKERDYLRCAAEIARAYYTSSPVVPAPTETEWQTWQEVPEGVWFLTNQNIGCWMRRDGDKVTTVTGGWPVCTDSLVAQAPFVAAEEG